MATGDNIWFEEARTLDYFAGWASSDTMKLAILDNTTAPTASTATPSLGDFTQVGSGGTYTAGGETLDTWGNMWSEAAGVGTFDDTGADVSWAADASNDTDAYWGLIYNDTQAGDPAVCFIELGGPVDMTAGELKLTWNASGIMQITAA